MSLAQHLLDVAGDVGAEARIDLVEHVAAVIERPHLAHRLVADAGDDAADVVEDGVDRPPLGVPVALRLRQLVADAVALAPGLIGHHVLQPLLVREVVDPGPHVDDRAEGGMAGDVGDALAVHPDLAAVTQRLPILLAGSQGHRPPPR
jgi:hypothetical protein